jgi:hypothetical protein
MAYGVAVVALDSGNQVSILREFQQAVEARFMGCELTFEYIEGTEGGLDTLAITSPIDLRRELREFIASSMEVTEPPVRPAERWKPFKHIRSPD